VRVLCSTTANDGHFGPLSPFALACAEAGHEVRVAAPASYGAALARVGLPHEPFADAPPEVIGPVMATLPSLTFEEANEVVIREVFGRIDAQAALPSLLETVERWRPHIVVRESAELASLAAAERFDVPHVHVCIGMQEVASHLAGAIADPLAELDRLAGVAEGQLATALGSETVLSLVPELLDRAAGEPRGADDVKRFHEPVRSTNANRPPEWGDPGLPLVYVTFGSVTGSIPPFAGVFREAVDALAGLEASVVMTVGRDIDPQCLGPLPTNAHVEQWLPQETVLGHAAAMIGHGGFGTTMGALAAGVPQVVVPLFTFDQVVNGDHVASVGAGLTMGTRGGGVERAAAEVPRLLEDPTYAEGARRVAAAIRDLPPPSEAVPVLTDLAG
jgi:UDP:flavonoid glycosyltransferase YjiC (YdhE family)